MLLSFIFDNLWTLFFYYGYLDILFIFWVVPNKYMTRSNFNISFTTGKVMNIGKWVISCTP